MSIYVEEAERKKKAEPEIIAECWTCATMQPNGHTKSGLACYEPKPLELFDIHGDPELIAERHRAAGHDVRERGSK